MSVARGRAARPAPADGDGADYGEVVGGLRRDVVPDVNGTQASPRLEARSLEARSLEGRAYRLPEDLEGEHNVVIVGFEWWQQTLIPGCRHSGGWPAVGRACSSTSWWRSPGRAFRQEG